MPHRPPPHHPRPHLTAHPRVYSSKPWTHQNDTLTAGVWYTQRQGSVYAIVLDWPEHDILQLGAVSLAADSKVFMLGCQDPIKVSVTERLR